MTQTLSTPAHKPTEVRLVSRRAETRAGIIALVVGVILLVVKFVAYLLTHSQAVYSDALETIVNVVASGFAIYSILLAHRPADVDHPYGHGKIEFFSAGLEGGMMLLAAVMILGKVGAAMLHGGGAASIDLNVGLILMGGALLINGGLGAYLWYAGKRHNSITLQAGGIHLITDAVDSVVVLLALIAVRITGWQWIDTAAALLVVVYICWLAIGLIKRSAAGLMDEQDAGDQNLLIRILDSHVGPSGKEPRICSYHKLRHRHSGRYHWVDFHVMVPAWWDIQRGHKVASAIEYEIELALKEGNATAHVEPCVQPDCRNCQSAKGELLNDEC